MSVLEEVVVVLLTGEMSRLVVSLFGVSMVDFTDSLV